MVAFSRQVNFLRLALFVGVVCICLSVGVVIAHAQGKKDPLLSELWYLKAIHVPSAYTFGRTPVVAVLDAGFDLSHEDLLNQYWTNDQEAAGDRKDNDRNGFEDDVHGWDFVDNDADPSPDVSDPKADDLIVSHGTLVAGIIAAEANNGKGIAGIAPGAKIMALRILDSQGRGTTAQVRDAIEYAVKNGADVINLSLVSKKPDDLLQQTIEWAVDQGVVVVAAVGNDRLNVDRDPTFPACFDTRIGINRVIGVAAIGKNGKKAVFSNDGSHCVDLVAPGEDILGAVYHDPSNWLYSTSYGSPFEGTSISVPMVTGAVAVLRGTYPTLTPEQIRLSLMLSADPLLAETPEQRGRLGAGALNIERALTIAAQFIASPQSVPVNLNVRPTQALVVAQGRGVEPVVKRVSADGAVLSAFYAYDKRFLGGVRVAVGDVNGDGVEEIVTVPGPGGGPHVRIFDVSGKLLSQFFAFDPSDRLGLNVAIGDLNHDGLDDIVVSQGAGGTGQVRLFTMRGSMFGSFYPFGRTTQPVSVTVGNFDEDADQEITAVLGGTDKKHQVKIFDANGRYVRDFIAATKEASGLRVATWHSAVMPVDQIIVTPEGGFVPWVWVHRVDGSMAQSSIVYQSGFRGGVQVVTGDVNADGVPEVYTAATGTGGPHVRTFDALMRPNKSFFPFESTYRFGLSIALWNP